MRSSALCARPLPLICHCAVSSTASPNLACVALPCTSTGASALLPACQRVCACCTLALPTRRPVASHWPSVRRSGQRPLTCALALTAPARAAARPGGCINRHNGASRPNSGAARLRVQRSAAAAAAETWPLPEAIARLPVASRLLPAASSFNTACSGLPAALRRAASPLIATPANTLRAMFSVASPCSAASRSLSGSALSNTGAGNSRSRLPLALRRCGPLRQGESCGPDHQGSGSKSTSAVSPFTCHGARSSAR